MQTMSCMGKLRRCANDWRQLNSVRLRPRRWRRSAGNVWISLPPLLPGVAPIPMTDTRPWWRKIFLKYRRHDGARVITH